MDVDIDVPPTFDRSMFPWVRATVVRDGQLTPHPCGMYPQRIAADPITGLSAMPYEFAEEHGYLKLDFLHLNVYSYFTERAEIEKLIALEPDWTLLQLPSNHAKLFQLANHGELLIKTKPTNIEDLADVLALIRPGKKTLLGLYLKDKVNARKALWAQDDSGFSFKKSHALSYSYVIILQLHLIEQGRL